MTATGAPIDPSTVTLVVEAPDASESTYTYPASVIRDSVGNYHLDYPVPPITALIPGVYRYRWTSTGTGQASLEGWFQVRVRLVP